jgi:hypothetical protein
LSCSGGKAASDTSTQKPTAASQPASAPAALDRVPREEFNRLAAELNLPLFWVADANENNSLEPAEVAVLGGVLDVPAAEWVGADGFTPKFTAAYESVAKLKVEGHAPPADAEEAARRAAVVKELSQGRPTLVLSDFSAATEEDKAVVAGIKAAAVVVERLFAKQSGSFGLDKEIPADDTASRTLFHRNQGPWCEAPATEKDPQCNALPSKPAKRTGVYPADIQVDKFCETLAARKDQKALLDPFVVVAKDEKGALKPVPYNVVYKEDMEEVAQILDGVAKAVQSPTEAAFKAYLSAAAQSFRDNNWDPADEAWAKMNAENSKWYLRIGPDEVYFEPCSRKAGFHVSFARINQGSLTWQQRLDPVKNDMEAAMAAVAGPPYKARQVSFHLPDFIDIIINAGDARPAHGATIGQSLPNWGPVANGGRGRTVVMTNFYTDPDSKRAFGSLVESVLCKESMASFTLDEQPQLMSTVLHEAAHNLGPSHEYKVKGKTDDEVFGGPLASVMEELKAQTAALFYTDWLKDKGIIDAKAAAEAHTRDITWAFGHISRGMYDGDKPKPYSQLAAIQVGFLVKEGAITWKAEEAAANGVDKGCLALHVDKFPPAIKKLSSAVFSAKAKGDKKAAEALKAEFVDKAGPWKDVQGVITERWLRLPKASFVYAIKE